MVSFNIERLQGYLDGKSCTNRVMEKTKFRHAHDQERNKILQQVNELISCNMDGSESENMEAKGINS